MEEYTGYVIFTAPLKITYDKGSEDLYYQKIAESIGSATKAMQELHVTTTNFNDKWMEFVSDGMYGWEINEDGSLVGLSRKLPGVMEQTKYPCNCKFDEEECLWEIIQHLNDDHHWTRNRIADWLETLDIDLEFKGGDE